MTNEERLQAYMLADEHQFDEDPNAKLVIGIDDPVLKAVEYLEETLGGYGELVIYPSSELIEVIERIQSYART